MTHPRYYQCQRLQSLSEILVFLACDTRWKYCNSREKQAKHEWNIFARKVNSSLEDYLAGNKYFSLPQLTYATIRHI